MCRTGLLYLCVPLLLALLPGCGKQPEKAADPIRPVRYTEVWSGGIVAERIFSGVTKAALDADLSFKVPGNVTAVEVSVGDRVGPGELVASLDPTDYEVQLREAEAGLQRAGAELRNARANFDRTRELYENRNVAKSDLDNARAAAESAKALVAAAEQQLEAARLQRSYARLFSPQNCTIAERYVEPNQNVSAGQPIVRVNCGECPEVTVDVPAAWIGRIVQGARALVKVAALDKRKISAVVSEIGVTSERGASAYPVTLMISDHCGEIRAGMAAEGPLALMLRHRTHRRFTDEAAAHRAAGHAGPYERSRGWPIGSGTLTVDPNVTDAASPRIPGE